MKHSISKLKHSFSISREELKRINGGAACYSVICGLTQAQCYAYPLMINYNASKGCCSIENPGC